MAEEKIVVNSNPLPEVVGWGLRAGTIVLGTWLVSKGYISDAETFAGYVMAIGGAGYGLWRTLQLHSRSIKLADDAKIGVVK